MALSLILQTRRSQKSTPLPGLQGKATGDVILLFVVVFLDFKQYWPGGFMFFFVVLCPEAPKGSTAGGCGFKASQKTGQRLKVSSCRLGEAGNWTCDPWFTRHRFIPYTKAETLFAF